jgi:hypothetical protein
MNSYQLYNCKANPISGAVGSFPAEALWWGGDLSRRVANAAGNDKNPTIEKYDVATRSIVRETNLYNEENGHGRYYFQAPNGGRAAFWGDLLGDWREELIYGRRDSTGFVILSTWDETTHRQYCLMQNPAYRGQTTARGYYQTADVDFYMAADMPQPPIAPVQQADVYLTTGNTLTSAITDGQRVMLDIRNPNSTISVTDACAPTRLWLMNPKGKNYTLSGSGKLTGTGDVIKSLQGDVTFNGQYDYTGVTRISEGRLFVNGSLAGPVQVDARGTIGGKGTLKGGIALEKGLNVEGGRIEPGDGADLGSLTIVGNLTLPGRNNLAFDIDQSKPAKNDSLLIVGDFTVSGSNHSLIINQRSAPQADTLTLITFTGTTNATPDQFTVRGLEGVPFTLMVEAHSLKLAIIQPRSAGSVVWHGTNSSVWDFQSRNFKIGSSEEFFVPGDIVLFTDEALVKTILINETMPVGGLTFTNNTDYRLSGQGVISGNGGLVKMGTGKVSLLTSENTLQAGWMFRRQPGSLFTETAVTVRGALTRRGERGGLLE